MIAIKIILLLGFLLTLWISYSLIYFFYGDKIKTYYLHQCNMREAGKLQRELEEMRLLKLLERNRIEEVEVIDEGVRTWDIVKHGERTSVQYDLVLDITNNKALDRVG